ncbi:hypothetical protein PF006_g23503 [Phytophthora fragariae]|uniref:Uncharacterized protein n=1 Tax=Phytophthora fragariae TaxID=53985 RepID=A0A6A3RIU4_9STRA|nr:hypothetical protein PF009_g25173 [Phytophthora fragariae]KAE9097770.1 hypothetical protein PF006_g23503 [Phytophthora fragariae]
MTLYFVESSKFAPSLLGFLVHLLLRFLLLGFGSWVFVSGRKSWRRLWTLGWAVIARWLRRRWCRTSRGILDDCTAYYTVS